jgi:L-rhamnose mutarotase
VERLPNKQLPDGYHYLFSYFEYTGDDYEQDMRRMAADQETQRWWDLCKPCLEPTEDLPPGEVWAPMDQVFYQA